MTERTKQLTRHEGDDRKRKPSTESTVRGRTKDMKDAPLVLLPSVDQCRSGEQTSDEKRKAYRKIVFVPVVNSKGKKLMPTIPSRARRWIKSKKATPFFVKGIFCVRLNEETLSDEIQQVVVGIDPGSKKEAFTVKSKAHTFLNLQQER